MEEKWKDPQKTSERITFENSQKRYFQKGKTKQRGKLNLGKRMTCFLELLFSLRNSWEVFSSVDFSRLYPKGVQGGPKKHRYRRSSKVMILARMISSQLPPISEILARPIYQCQCISFCPSRSRPSSLLQPNELFLGLPPKDPEKKNRSGKIYPHWAPIKITTIKVKKFSKPKKSTTPPHSQILIDGKGQPREWYS